MAAPAVACRPPARSTRRISGRLVTRAWLARKRSRMQRQPRAARQCMHTATHALASFSQHPENCSHIYRQVSCPSIYEGLCDIQRGVLPGTCLLRTASTPWQPRHAASQTQSASQTDCWTS